MIKHRISLTVECGRQNETERKEAAGGGGKRGRGRVNGKPKDRKK